MSRADLVLHLAALVARHAITQAQAQRLLAAFDAGELDEGDLPSTAEPQHDRNDWLLALAVILLLTGGNTTRKLSTAKRRQARITLRSGYQATVQQLAVGVTSGALAIGAWQSAMQVNIAGYARQMAVAGAGTLPSGATQAAVEAKLAQQWPFLQTFAVQIAATQAGVAARHVGATVVPTVTGGPISAVAVAAQAPKGGPISALAIAARGNQYGGVGWGSFFAGQGNDAGYGIVDVWFTRDDGHVCPRCGPRHGQYFQVGVGPYPGWDCFGSCRCERRPEYLPEIYVQLGGLAVAPVQAGNRVQMQPTLSQLQRSAPPVPPGPPQRPVAQSGGGQPQGRRVSQALLVSSRNPITEPVREAVAAIDSVHGDGDLPDLPVVPALIDGEGKYTERHGKPYAIFMNPNATEMRYTLTHEVAHFLDNQQLNMSGDLEFLGWKSATSNGDPIHSLLPEGQIKWKEAVDKSGAVQELMRLAAGGQRTEFIGGQHLPVKTDFGNVNYLLQYDEIWARSYAQYITVRSGDPALLIELGRRLNPNDYTKQWQADDFEEIGQAIDELFSAKGWRI